VADGHRLDALSESPDVGPALRAMRMAVIAGGTVLVAVLLVGMAWFKLLAA
jgi:hypothetical protein